LEDTIAEMQEQAKRELTKLKITFEKDIEQVTHKWQADKEKMKLEEFRLRDEYEARISEDEMRFDEERQFLQTQLSQLQFELQATLDKRERELMLLRNEHENLLLLHSQKLDQVAHLEQTSAS